jgi:hypothetical protein
MLAKNRIRTFYRRSLLPFACLSVITLTSGCSSNSTIGSDRICPPNPPKLNGEQEAQLIALCCSTPPEGRAHWSLRLITKELKTRGIVTEISHLLYLATKVF